jgi:hypothetical protein
MSDASAARKVALPTLASLAEQLRDGPLKCLTALQDHATTLAELPPTADAELLERLQTLVHLTHCSMARFHEFTVELRALIDHLAVERDERH